MIHDNTTDADTDLSHSSHDLAITHYKLLMYVNQHQHIAHARHAPATGTSSPGKRAQKLYLVNGYERLT